MIVMGMHLKSRRARIASRHDAGVQTPGRPGWALSPPGLWRGARHHLRPGGSLGAGQGARGLAAEDLSGTARAAARRPLAYGDRPSTLKPTAETMRPPCKARGRDPGTPGRWGV